MTLRYGSLAADILRGIAIGLICGLAGFALLLLLALVGCASVDPRVSTVTNTVSVPVPVPCIAAVDIPAPPKPTPVDVERATTDQIVAGLAADVMALDQYASVADALLKQCAKP